MIWFLSVVTQYTFVFGILSILIFLYFTVVLVFVLIDIRQQPVLSFLAPPIFLPIKKLSKIIKEKPGLREGAYMGLIISKVGKELDKRKAMEILVRLLKK